MSALHLNISSMSKHFDDLNTMLSLLEYKFSFIGITETRMLRDQESFLDFTMPGYSEFSTPTEQLLVELCCIFQIVSLLNRGLILMLAYISQDFLNLFLLK